MFALQQISKKKDIQIKEDTTCVIEVVGQDSHGEVIQGEIWGSELVEKVQTQALEITNSLKENKIVFCWVAYALVRFKPAKGVYFSLSTKTAFNDLRIFLPKSEMYERLASRFVGWRNFERMAINDCFAQEEENKKTN